MIKIRLSKQHIQPKNFINIAEIIKTIAVMLGGFTAFTNIVQNTAPIEPR
jgi:hypothetical protein